MADKEDSFFGKNGTLQSLIDFSKDYEEGVSKGFQNLSNMKSGNAFDRMKGIIDTASAIAALFI